MNVVALLGTHFSGQAECVQNEWALVSWGCVKTGGKEANVGWTSELDVLQTSNRLNFADGKECN